MIKILSGGLAEWHCAALEKRCPQGLGGSNPPPSASENPSGSNPRPPANYNRQRGDFLVKYKQYEKDISRYY